MHLPLLLQHLPSPVLLLLVSADPAGPEWPCPSAAAAPAHAGSAPAISIISNVCHRVRVAVNCQPTADAQLSQQPAPVCLEPPHPTHVPRYPTPLQTTRSLSDPAVPAPCAHSPQPQSALPALTGSVRPDSLAYTITPLTAGTTPLTSCRACSCLRPVSTSAAASGAACCSCATRAWLSCSCCCASFKAARSCCTSSLPCC